MHEAPPLPHYGMSFHVDWLLLRAFSDSHVALQTARCLAAVKDDGWLMVDQWQDKTLPSAEQVKRIMWVFIQGIDSKEKRKDCDELRIPVAT